MNGAPKLLVSVRNGAEAVDAIAGGADWIDLKEPRRGPLGAVDAAMAREVVACVDRRAPISAAAGELVEIAEEASELCELLAVPEIVHIKLGLTHCAGRNWQRDWSAAHEQILAAGKQHVAVIYADSAAAHSPPAEEILDVATAAGCTWALWDTFDKTATSIDQQVDHHDFIRQLKRARDGGLRTAVAGRVDERSLARLPLERIDMIAVRGAVCRGSRDAAVSLRKTRSLRSAIARHADCKAILR